MVRVTTTTTTTLREVRPTTTTTTQITIKAINLGHQPITNRSQERSKML